MCFCLLNVGRLMDFQMVVHIKNPAGNCICMLNYKRNTRQLTRCSKILFQSIPYMFIKQSRKHVIKPLFNAFRLNVNYKGSSKFWKKQMLCKQKATLN